MRDDDRGIRRHAGTQLQLVVVHADHGGISDHVLIGRGSITHLLHCAAKLARRKRIHGEGDWLSFLDAAHVGFRHHGFDFHFAEVIGDDEQLGRVETGRDRLTDFDVARNDHAVDGCVNGRPLQVRLDLFEGCLADFDHRLGLMQVSDRLFLV